MALPGFAQTSPFYLPNNRESFTNMLPSQSASALHAPPGLGFTLNHSLQLHSNHPLLNPGQYQFSFEEQSLQDGSGDHPQQHPFPFDELSLDGFSDDFFKGMDPAPTMQPPPPPPLQPYPFGEESLQDGFGGEQSLEDFSDGIYMCMAPPSPPPLQPWPSPPPPMEPVVKKKRGRPKKLIPDENQDDLGLPPKPSSLKRKNSTSSSSSSSMADTNTPKRARGRPPGTGKLQRLANRGDDWMSSSAGIFLETNVIDVEAGKDIVSKLYSYAEERPRGLCILSATGSVSSVMLRHPVSLAPSFFYPGHFDILSLQGSYLVDEAGGPKSRTGGLSITFSLPDGHCVSGGVKEAIAASPVQVMAFSFLYGSAKDKAIKQGKWSKNEDKDKMDTPESENSTLITIESLSEVEAKEAEGEDEVQVQVQVVA